MGTDRVRKSLIVRNYVVDIQNAYFCVQLNKLLTCTYLAAYYWFKDVKFVVLLLTDKDMYMYVGTQDINR